MSSKILVGTIILVIAGLAFVVDGPKSLQRSSTPIAQDMESESPGPRGRGADGLPADKHIRLFGPRQGEILKYGGVVELRWENYLGSEPLNIIGVSDGLTFEVAKNLPGTASGRYEWKIAGAPLAKEAHLEIYPTGGREFVGRSVRFTIQESPYVILEKPAAMDIDASTPVEISGTARSVFSEGGFLIQASYEIDSKKIILSSVFATCDMNGDGCDWTSGQWLPFKAELNLSRAPVCQLLIEFFVGEKSVPQESFYSSPVHLHGIEACI